MIIRFDFEEEFIEELKRDKDHIERNIVRLTKLRQREHATYFFFVFGTAKIDGDLIKLKRFVDSAMTNERIKQVTNKTQELLEEIAEELKEQGFEIRAGYWKEGNMGRKHKKVRGQGNSTPHTQGDTPQKNLPEGINNA